MQSVSSAQPAYGNAVLIHDRAALSFYEAAANAGDLDAALAVGDTHLDGVVEGAGGAADALRFYRIAHDAGDADGTAALADVLVSERDGVPVDVCRLPAFAA